MSGRFLAIGECMVELAPAAGKGLLKQGFAGDTFNSAWYARQLLPDAWTVSYGTCVGTDTMSDKMLAFTAQSGIDTGQIRRLDDRRLGLYLIEVTNGERSFSYWRDTSAARHIADDAAWLTQLCTGNEMILISGITLAILPLEGRIRLCNALNRARARGTRVAFDTNMRPQLWRDADAMRAGIMMGASVADIVLPSFDEEQAAFGDATPADTIARYRGQGAQIVVVKNGAEPVRLSAGEAGTQDIAVVPVAQIVDSTAAGDSFGATFLAALLTNSSATEAAEAAAQVAARVILAPGALVDLSKGKR